MYPHPFSRAEILGKYATELTRVAAVYGSVVMVVPESWIERAIYAYAMEIADKLPEGIKNTDEARLAILGHVLKDQLDSRIEQGDIRTKSL